MANNGDGDYLSSMQSALANANELRALHAALLQRGSPLKTANSPLSQYSARDYPVFTPVSNIASFSSSISAYVSSLFQSYEIETFPAHSRKLPGSRIYEEDEESRRFMELMNEKFSPRSDVCKFHKRSSEFGDLSYCNSCRPAVITSEFGASDRKLNVEDSRFPAQSLPRKRGLISRLITNLRKPYSPSRGGSDASQCSGVLSVEGMRLELVKAVENRKEALEQLSQMKGSMDELRKKLEHLESYCEGLKRALGEAVSAKSSMRKLGWPERMMEVGEEDMAEGFLQVASEARLSVSEFVKALARHAKEREIESLNFLIYPYTLSSTSKNPKSAMYHLEGIINQSMFENFENRAFERNGVAKQLNIVADREAQFASFVKLRRIACHEALRKGTKNFSEEFKRFCDRKLSCISERLKWGEEWPEKLREVFFVAAKCVRLLHLLAFSFNPPTPIMRVAENQRYDEMYMEDLFAERQKTYGPGRVKVVVMPGFYLPHFVLTSKVICTYK